MSGQTCFHWRAMKLIPSWDAGRYNSLSHRGVASSTWTVSCRVLQGKIRTSRSSCDSQSSAQNAAEYRHDRNIITCNNNNCCCWSPSRSTVEVWSDGLERTARQHQRYGSVNLLFHTLSEDSSFLLLLAYQRIRGFAFMRYINPRLTLTLTLTSVD